MNSCRNLWVNFLVSFCMIFCLTFRQGACDFLGDFFVCVYVRLFFAFTLLKKNRAPKSTEHSQKVHQKIYRQTTAKKSTGIPLKNKLKINRENQREDPQTNQQVDQTENIQGNPRGNPQGNPQRNPLRNPWGDLH